MEESNRENILRILKEAINAIKKDNVVTLRDLSNQTIHSASIFQDPDNIGVAVLMYSLSKILERTDYRLSKDWDKYYKETILRLEKAELALKQYKFEDFKNQLKDILQIISKLEPKLKLNIKEVFEKAKISKASRLYEHGISVGRTAELLGISQWELMEYSGETGISEKGITLDIIERIKYAKGLFR